MHNPSRPSPRLWHALTPLLLAALALSMVASCAGRTTTEFSRCYAQSDCAEDHVCRWDSEPADYACIHVDDLPLSCFNLIADVGETGFDCGGECPACQSASPCLKDNDCITGVCVDDRCIARHCDDGIVSGNETAVDCGGSCGRCALGATCRHEQDCASGVCTDDGFCKIPGFAILDGGTFTMGSPEAEPGRAEDEGVHDVLLTYRFIVKASEVTQAEYQVVTGEEPSLFDDCGFDCPVESVTWYDAVAFCNALSEAQDLPRCYLGVAPDITFVGVRCRGYRLPSEAEWEFAVRGGADGPVYTYGDGTEAVEPGVGCDAPGLDPIAWHCGNADAQPGPVADKLPNAYGLHDMLGNVWEWVHDAYGDYATIHYVDPIGPKRGSAKVVRGGAFDSGAEDIRSARRRGLEPDTATSNVGFRVARTVQ